ncbi:MAG TPA: hypothetical protein VK778_11760 [Solirubrobacteraceae bacterium]|jgi:hypothetical protein|nr:hypothetical protein [Solirubrobacteraceae bacterium]
MLARRGVSAALALALALAVASSSAMVWAAGASGEGASSIPAPPPAPANDALANAQPVQSLPATISGTTVGATTEAGEHESSCHQSTANSVWYSLHVTAAKRVGIDLTAAGALDATVDVYHAVRSQLTPVECQETEGQGKAALSFPASKNGQYDIRVAAVQGSQLAGFTLEVFVPTPAVRPPGPALPAAGVSGQVDRVQNINAAYSFPMRAGVSYLINLANETRGACVSGALFAPGTTSFGAEEGAGEEGEGEGSPSGLVDIRCGGYRLFTPEAGKGGLYSFEITPRLSRSGVQRFHLQVAAAGPAETAPGLTLGNYAHAHGYLDGRGVRVLRLYRMEVTSHSSLTLKLSAPESARFKLQLRNQNGDVIECDCQGSGSQTLQRQLAPGTYYAVVSVRGDSAGSYTLVRESRTITATSISFTSAKVAPGEALAIDVKVSPAESGPVAVDIERFDPVFGWQFYREVPAFASGGEASVPFTPPTAGMWRAKATYEGTSTASPSAVGYSYLLVS